jgi:hypothetical protein
VRTTLGGVRADSPDAATAAKSPLPHQQRPAPRMIPPWWIDPSNNPASTAASNDSTRNGNSTRAEDDQHPP